MIFTKLIRIAILVPVSLICTNALADGIGDNKRNATPEEPEQTTGELESELQHRQFPTDERDSRFRQHWENSNKDTLTPKPDRRTPRDSSRAVSGADFDPIAKVAAGKKISKVEGVKPVTGGAEAESEVPSTPRIPAELRHRDRDHASDPDNKKHDDEK